MTSHEAFQLSAEVAEAYESTFVPTFFAQWAPRLLDAAGVGPGQRVLDVACGTGIVARTAADRVGPSGAVIGVDLNPAMLAVAARIRPELRWVEADAAELPLPDADVDVVVSQMAMMFFPDPVAALRQMRRVVRPQGTVAVLVPGSLTDNPPYQSFVDIVTRHAGDSARRLVTTYFALGDLDALTRLFTDAGLTVANADRVRGTSTFPTVDAFVSVEVDSTPLGEGLEASARQAIIADCRTALRESTGADGTLSFPFVSNVVTARPEPAA